MIIYHFFGQKTLMAPWDLQTNIKNFFLDIPNPTVSDSQPPCRPYPGCSFPPSAFGHTGAPAIPTHREWISLLSATLRSQCFLCLDCISLCPLWLWDAALLQGSVQAPFVKSFLVQATSPSPLISYNPPSVSTAHWKFLSHDVWRVLPYVIFSYVIKDPLREKKTLFHSILSPLWHLVMTFT